MISRLRAFGAFLYDFVIGDDWRVAVGVVVALAITYWLSHATKVADLVAGARRPGRAAAAHALARGPQALENLFFGIKHRSGSPAG